jgi:hypothetical protein
MMSILFAFPLLLISDCSSLITSDTISLISVDSVEKIPLFDWRDLEADVREATKTCGGGSEDKDKQVWPVKRDGNEELKQREEKEFPEFGENIKSSTEPGKKEEEDKTGIGSCKGRKEGNYTSSK